MDSLDVCEGVRVRLWLGLPLSEAVPDDDVVWLWLGDGDELPVCERVPLDVPVGLGLRVSVPVIEGVRVIDWLGESVTDPDCVSDGDAEELRVDEKVCVGVCVALGETDVDCVGVCVCVGVLLGEQTSLRPSTFMLA